jgi:hypothetical protein
MSSILFEGRHMIMHKPYHQKPIQATARDFFSALSHFHVPIKALQASTSRVSLGLACTCDLSLCFIQETFYTAHRNSVKLPDPILLLFLPSFFLCVAGGRVWAWDYAKILATVRATLVSTLYCKWRPCYMIGAKFGATRWALSSGLHG